MRWRVLAVVALAMLAGCGGFSTGSDDGAVSTVTPAPVPDAGLPAAEGVEVDGIDPAVIVENHNSALEDRSYTITERIRIGSSANVSYRQRTTAYVAPAADTVHIDTEITTVGPGFDSRETDVWWNGERTLYRYTFPGEEHAYYHVDQRPSGHLHYDGRLDDVLGAVEVVSVENGPGESSVVSGYLNDTRVVPRNRHLSKIENASVSMRIGEDGVVSKLAIGYTASHDDERERVRYTIRFSSVGSTSAEPPAWAETAAAVEDAY